MGFRAITRRICMKMEEISIFGHRFPEVNITFENSKDKGTDVRRLTRKLGYLPSKASMAAHNFLDPLR